MTGVIILSAYSAALISFLAVKVFVMPFTTMEGLLEDGTYHFGVVGESADYELFEVNCYLCVIFYLKIKQIIIVLQNLN